MKLKTASPNTFPVNDEETIKVLLMLYDGAIDYLDKAMAAYRSNDLDKRDYYINKANDIIVELDNAINRKDTSDIARNLTMLYSFMNRHLINACATNSMKAIRDVSKMMADLRGGWQHIRDSLSPSAA